MPGTACQFYVGGASIFSWLVSFARISQRLIQHRLRRKCFRLSRARILSEGGWMTLDSREREPPVEVSEETHGSGNEQSAHEGGIECDGQRHSQTERLDQYHVGCGKRG